MFAGFGSPLAIFRKLPLSAATLLVIAAARLRLLRLGAIIFVALPAGLHMLFVGSALVRHFSAPLVGGAIIIAPPFQPPEPEPVPSRNYM